MTRALPRLGWRAAVDILIYIGVTLNPIVMYTEQTDRHTHTHTHIYIYIYTHIYTHIYTYIYI